MRLAIVSGICVEHDAISAAVVEQAKLAASMDGVESVDVFAQYFDRSVGCVTHTVHNPWELLTHEAFEHADLVIFHFGIRYSILDAIVGVDPSRQRVAIHFHNITPVDLVSPADRPAIEHSYRQIVMPQIAGARYWYYSEFNRRTLLGWGVDESKMDFVPFPIEPPFELDPVADGSALELLCVGRMVPAKGTHVVIESLALARGRIDRPIRLTLVGNPKFSTDEYIAELDLRIHEGGLEDHVSIIADADDHTLWHCYESADVVVSASLHEGLCVPIIEGYLAGCRALGTTEGNLPFIVQPPDEVVAPNDPTALADAIVRVDAQLRDAAEFDHPNARALCGRYSRRTSATSMKLAIANSLSDGGSG